MAQAKNPLLPARMACGKLVGWVATVDTDLEPSKATIALAPLLPAGTLVSDWSTDQTQLLIETAPKSIRIVPAVGAADIPRYTNSVARSVPAVSTCCSRISS